MSHQFEFELPNDGIATRPATVRQALEQLSSAGDANERGAVFTQTSVVHFILDLVGYTPDRPLHELRFLEPSCGHGDFLLPAVTRLLNAWEATGSDHRIESALKTAIRAVELHAESARTTQEALVNLLTGRGHSIKAARELASAWVVQDDFLLTPMEGRFDFIVGNPPYVRQELIPPSLLSEYRSIYKTMYDRADLYIAFIERSLSLLTEGGTLGIICSDRWIKNRYGGPLRKMVSSEFHLKTYVDMVGTTAFHDEVTAYPAIVVIERHPPGPTKVATPASLDPQVLSALTKAINEDSADQGGVEATELTPGDSPWILKGGDRTSIIRRLEQSLPILEEAGCSVGIGVATGADKAFIADFDSMQVEPDRKLPLVQTKDIVSGEVVWRGQGVINPFVNEGGLVDLADYPKLRRYLEERRDVIAGRHCAKKAPDNWYRTIDRIHPELTNRPKLLIPDIKGEAHVVHEDGRLYPHHNLYYIVSTEWDLRALQAILLSAVTKAFVASYSTRMRGGYLRFQAQYLRRIRVPRWEDVPQRLKKELVTAAKRRDIAACNEAVMNLYDLDEKDFITLDGNGG